MLAWFIFHTMSINPRVTLLRWYDRRIVWERVEGMILWILIIKGYINVILRRKVIIDLARLLFNANCYEGVCVCAIIILGKRIPISLEPHIWYPSDQLILSVAGQIMARINSFIRIFYQIFQNNFSILEIFWFVPKLKIWVLTTPNNMQKKFQEVFIIR